MQIIHHFSLNEAGAMRFFVDFDLDKLSCWTGLNKT